MARRLIAALCLATLAAPQRSRALPSFDKKEDEDQRITVTFEGVDGSLLENVRALSSLHRLSASKELDSEMVGRLVQRAPAEARTALRPFGYYEPRVTTEFEEVDGRWLARVKIEPGTPVMLVDQQVEITGSGRDEPFMRAGPRAIAAAHRGATEPFSLRPAERRAAACGARPWLSRRRFHARRAPRRSGDAHAPART